MTSQLLVLLLAGGGSVLAALGGTVGGAAWKWMSEIVSTRKLGRQGTQSKPISHLARPVRVSITYEDGKTLEIEGHNPAALAQAVEASLETTPGAQ